MPSTNWKETIPPGEEERFARYAAQLRQMQQRNAGGNKAARALHAKGVAVARAELEILGGLPAQASQGLFAQPRRYNAYVRFSNGASKRQSDKVGDVRGMAVKVLGVSGPKVLADADTQDFLAIQTPATPFRTADEFVSVVLAAATPALALFRILGAVGFTRTVQILKRVTAGKPTATLAGTTFYSALPIRIGPYAARFAFFPLQAMDAPLPAQRSDTYLGDDLTTRLSGGPLSWEMRLQFFEDEQRTPIEDASVDWDAPYVPVARLVLPQQDLNSAEARKLAETLEQLSYDPWHALVEHTPLGGMMRARKAAYYESVQERGALPEPK
jgi:hypothetical protein